MGMMVPVLQHRVTMGIQNIWNRAYRSVGVVNIDVTYKRWVWNFLVVQWLSLLTLNGGHPGLIPGQGTRSHMPQ